MLLPVEAFVGIRYIYAPRNNHFIAFISITAIMATALGVAVLVTILSIMNGFEHELRNRILGMAPHLSIESNPTTSDWQILADAIADLPEVQSTAPYIRRDILLSYRGIVRVVEVRGIVPAFEVRATRIEPHIQEGTLSSLENGLFRIAVGTELAQSFGLSLGDKITVISPKPVVTPVGALPRLRRFEVAAIFEFGLHEHDSGLALINLQDAQRLFRMGGRIDGVRATLHEPSLAPIIGQKLIERGVMNRAGTLQVSDWTQSHRNIFRALRMEKIVMFGILAIAIGVAAFNIVSVLVVAVTQKRSDIALLSSLGLDRVRIMRIFLIQGGITGLLGVCVGLVFGLLLSANIGTIAASIEQLLGFKVLSPEIYYISDIPSEIRLWDFVMACVLAALLSLIAPLYPAWLAARTDVCEGLRDD